MILVLSLIVMVCITALGINLVLALSLLDGAQKFMRKETAVTYGIASTFNVIAIASAVVGILALIFTR